MINFHPFCVERCQRLLVGQQNIYFPLIQPILQMAKKIFLDNFLIGMVKNLLGRQGGEFFHSGVKFRFGPFIEQIAPILGAFVLKEVVHHFADIVRIHAAIRDGGITE